MTHHNNPPNSPILLTQSNKNQARLRLAWVNPDFSDDLFKYGQSTSGRKASTGTSPPLSRSSKMVVSVAMGSLVDIALRRYPTVVPHLRAYDSCSPRSSELRYMRSGPVLGSESVAIGDSLPAGKEKSIPWGHLPSGNRLYADDMSEIDPLEEIYAIRRERLAQLVEEHRGTSRKGHATLVRAINSALEGHPELEKSIKTFMDASYISRAISGPPRIENGNPAGVEGGKNIGEEPAAVLERLFKKPLGWMSRRDVEEIELPVDVSPGLWGSLTSEEKRRAGEQFVIFVKGLLSNRGRVG